MRTSTPLIGILALVGLSLLTAPPASAQQAKVYGVVTDASGTPVEKAVLLLEPQPGKGGVKATATTNKKGKYLIGLVRPGAYDVTLTAPDLVLRKIKGKALSVERKVDWEIDGTVAEGKPWEIVVADGQDITLDFTMARAVQAAGGGGPALSAEGALGGVAQQVQAGDCSGALPQLQHIVAASPDLATAHYLLGYCQANQGQPEAAVASLARSLELKPDQPGVALLKGQVQGRLGQVAEAEALLKQEIQLNANPELVSKATVALAVLYRDHDRPDDAIATFRQLAAAKPDQPEPYVEMASLYMKQGKAAEAEKVLAEARAAGALVPRALLNVGITYLNAKDYQHAEQVFRQVIEAGGENVDMAMAWSLLARTQLHGGLTAEAIRSLEQAQQLDPSGKMSEENKEILGQLKK